MNHAEKEIKRLADFLLDKYSHEVEEGNFNGESPVNIAIRLLKRDVAMVRRSARSFDEFDGDGI